MSDNATHNWETFEGKYDSRSSVPFNRKAFDLSISANWRSLATLRSQGSARRSRYEASDNQNNMHLLMNCGSSALRNLSLPEMPESKDPLLYVDCGAGYSVDTEIAARFGYKAVGYDLFPDGCGVVKADVVESIPHESGSVYALTSQAMIDLVEVHERKQFYREVFRVLCAGGSFSQVGQSLHCGHGFDAAKELERVRTIGFRAIDVRPMGFVAVK